MKGRHAISTTAFQQRRGPALQRRLHQKPAHRSHMAAFALLRY
jgi:hypothetical protein